MDFLSTGIVNTAVSVGFLRRFDLWLSSYLVLTESVLSISRFLFQSFVLELGGWEEFPWTPWHHTLQFYYTMCGTPWLAINKPNRRHTYLLFGHNMLFQIVVQGSFSLSMHVPTFLRFHCCWVDGPTTGIFATHTTNYLIPMTTGRRWGTSTDASSVMVVHRLLSSVMRSSATVTGLPILHFLMLSFHGLIV